MVGRECSAPVHIHLLVCMFTPLLLFHLCCCHCQPLDKFVKKMEYLEKTSQVYKGWFPCTALLVYDSCTCVCTRMYVHVCVCTCVYVHVCLYILFLVGIAIKTKNVLVHVKGLAKCHRGRVCAFVLFKCSLDRR